MGGGVWGVERPFPQGFDPLPTQSAPFDTFSEIHFWPTDPKIFLKAPLRQYILTLRGGGGGGGRAKKERDFFVNFSNVSKNGFLTVFSKICLRRRKFCQNRGKTVLWESSKNQFGLPKKKRSSKFWKTF